METELLLTYSVPTVTSIIENQIDSVVLDHFHLY